MFWESKTELNGFTILTIRFEELKKELKNGETEIIELEKQLKQKQVEQNKKKRELLSLKKFFKLKNENLRADLRIWNDLNNYLKDLDEKPD